MYTCSNLALPCFFHLHDGQSSVGFTTLWLRVVFAVSVKVPADSLLRMVQDDKHSVSEKLLESATDSAKARLGVPVLLC